MSSFELNKVAAAILLAGVIAMLVAFIGETLVHPHKKLEQNAYVIEGVAAAAPAGGAAPEEAKIDPIAPLMAAAKPEEGATIAKACAACHSFDKGGAAKVGPNLYDVLGAQHAHAQGFAYSSAMQKLAGEKWDYEELNKFLASPKAYAPGTKMTFVGLRKPEQRAAVIAYLRSLSDSPKPLP